jgi:hypothetical protein
MATGSSSDDELLAQDGTQVTEEEAPEEEEHIMCGQEAVEIANPQCSRTILPVTCVQSL